MRPAVFTPRPRFSTSTLFTRPTLSELLTQQHALDEQIERLRLQRNGVQASIECEKARSSSWAWKRVKRNLSCTPHKRVWAGQNRSSEKDWMAVLLAVHLVRTRSPHAGQFVGGAAASSVQLKIDAFLKHSSFAARSLAAGSLRMIVIHDVPTLNLSSYANVSLHRLSLRNPIPANDARWDAYGEVLHELPPRTCVFAVDFGDVAPLRDFRQLCNAQPHALFVGSDNCASPGGVQALAFVYIALLVVCGHCQRGVWFCVERARALCCTYMLPSGTRPKPLHTLLFGGACADKARVESALPSSHCALLTALPTLPSPYTVPSPHTLPSPHCLLPTLPSPYCPSTLRCPLFYTAFFFRCTSSVCIFPQLVSPPNPHVQPTYNPHLHRQPSQRCEAMAPRPD